MYVAGGALDGGPEVGAGFLQRIAGRLGRPQQRAQHAARGGRPPRAVRRTHARFALRLRLLVATVAAAGRGSRSWEKGNISVRPGVELNC